MPFHPYILQYVFTEELGYFPEIHSLIIMLYESNNYSFLALNFQIKFNFLQLSPKAL